MQIKTRRFLKSEFVFLKVAILVVLSCLIPGQPMSAEKKQTVYDIQNRIEIQLGSIKASINDKDGEVLPQFEPYNKEGIQLTLQPHNLVSGKNIKISGKDYLMVPFSGAIPEDSNINENDLVFLIPKVSDSKLNLANLDANYKPAESQKNLLTKIFDIEDHTVFPNQSTGKAIYLTGDPDFDPRDCEKNKKIAPECLAKITNQNKLFVRKAIISHPYDDDPSDDSSPMAQVVYQVETAANYQTCTRGPKDKPGQKTDCHTSSKPIVGWIPADSTLDFRRDKSLYNPKQSDMGVAQAKIFQKLNHHFGYGDGESVSAANAQTVRPVPKKTKKTGSVRGPRCANKTLSDSGVTSELAQALEEASKYSVPDSEIGGCPVEAEKYVQKMKDAIESQKKWKLGEQQRLRKSLIQARKEFQESGGIPGSPFAKKVQDLDRELLNLSNKNNEVLRDKLGPLWQHPDNPFDHFLRDHWEKKEKAKDTSGLSMDQMLSIDSLARSLFGEMRKQKCTQNTTAYMESNARSLMNRAAMVKLKGGQVENFLSPDYLRRLSVNNPNESSSQVLGAKVDALPAVSKEAAIANIKQQSIFKILPYVLTSDAQVTSWDPRDPNLAQNLCPSPIGEFEKKSWQIARAVAKDAVLNTEKFLEKTRDLAPAILYSSGRKFTPSWADNKGVAQIVGANVHTNFYNMDTQNVEVRPVEVAEGDCIKIYSVEKYKDELIELKKQQKKYFSHYETLELDQARIPVAESED